MSEAAERGGGEPPRRAFTDQLHLTPMAVPSIEATAQRACPGAERKTHRTSGPSPGLSTADGSVGSASRHAGRHARGTRPLRGRSGANLVRPVRRGNEHRVPPREPTRTRRPRTHKAYLRG
ncbi:hypothetical protein SKAU_G00349810 [Synaphobranchus kaupii]|uniref:Uncharacterized protein n=1 Tax=Synaphobranchus kaupii TaxID=118154 RepID=A0A9Q1IFX0_SYNKA|nr:hypothetical protein SKAU_G00349810 [Synaphobranchus kaupii]